MHLTTRVKTDPHQNLLREKGGSGFPYLVFMNAEGDVIAQQRDRSVAGFTKTLTALTTLASLEKKAAAGDRDAAVELFIAQLDLGKHKVADAKARLKELGELSPEQRARVNEPLTNLEVQELMSSARSADAQKAVREQLLAMRKEGRVPTGMYATSFWSQLLMKAEADKDIPLAEDAATHLKELMKSRPGAERMLKQLDERLAKLKGGSGEPGEKTEKPEKSEKNDKTDK